MSLYQQINTDLVTAMKARDAERLSALRMLQSALKNEAINLLKKDLSDEEVYKVIRSEVKKRKDSIADYESAKRNDLADKEIVEVKILEEYLPAQLSDEELSSRIDVTLAALSDEEKANFGRAMGKVIKEIGSAADGNRVRAMLQSKLGQ